jgi:hypothetical protein
MPERDPLPDIHFDLSLDDLFLIYQFAACDERGDPCADLPRRLLPLIVALRGRYLEERIDAMLGTMENAPDWLIAQTTLKERSI